jgi:hypothetical protein
MRYQKIIVRALKAFVAKPAVTAAQAKIQIAKDTVRVFLVESSLSERQNANTPTGIRTMLQKSRVAMPDPVSLNCLYRSPVERNLRGRPWLTQIETPQSASALFHPPKCCGSRVEGLLITGNGTGVGKRRRLGGVDRRPVSVMVLRQLSRGETGVYNFLTLILHHRSSPLGRGSSLTRC